MLVLKSGPGRPGPSRAQARAFLNGPQPGTNKSRAVSCPPDGLVVRLRHGTSLVNRAVPANVPNQKMVQNPSKVHFFKISQFVIRFIRNSLCLL
jgi:hypothetical protein